eukprot:scaffold124938_cov60-Phaeocystis_antarctica.AAC.1
MHTPCTLVRIRVRVRVTVRVTGYTAGRDDLVNVLQARGGRDRLAGHGHGGLEALESGLHDLVALDRLRRMDRGACVCVRACGCAGACGPTGACVRGCGWVSRARAAIDSMTAAVTRGVMRCVMHCVARCGALCDALCSHATHREQPHDRQAAYEAEAPRDEPGRGHDRIELVEARAAAFLLAARGQLGHVVLGRGRRWRGRRLSSIKELRGGGIGGRFLSHEQLALLAAEHGAAANGGDACPRLGGRCTEEQDGGDRPHDSAVAEECSPTNVCSRSSLRAGLWGGRRATLAQRRQSVAERRRASPS